MQVISCRDKSHRMDDRGASGCWGSAKAARVCYAILKNVAESAVTVMWPGDVDLYSQDVRDIEQRPGMSAMMLKCCA